MQPKTNDNNINNNWPANHVALFESHTRQFLSWNRAVYNCMQETCTRKNLYTIDWHMCKCFCTCTSFWYKFVERLSL